MSEPHALALCLQRIARAAQRIPALARQLNIIATEIQQLQAAGMYDQVPTESWETRNGGQTRYLRLVFPTDGAGRTKIYIGNDPLKIEEARAMIDRRKTYDRWAAEQRRIAARVASAAAMLTRVLERLGDTDS